jgi:hypothetical protein
MAGMEGLSAQIFEGGFRALRKPFSACEEPLAIEGISEERVAEMAKMNPDLVGSACFEPAFNQRRLARKIKAFHNPVMRDGLAASRPHRHLLTIDERAAERRGNDAFGAAGPSPDKGLIGPLDPAVTPMSSKKFAQSLMSLVGLGDDKKPGGVLVEAVNDAWTADAADAGETVPAMGDKRIDQGSRMMAGSGVNDETCRLVDDDEMGILIHDGQFNGFCPGHGVGGLRQSEPYAGARFDPEARLNYGPPVHLHAARQDQALDACAADIIEPPAQPTVETLASVGRLDRGGSAQGGIHMRNASGGEAEAIAGRPNGEQDPPNVRVLKYVVIFLGVLLIGCFIAVFAIIGYRLANPSKATGQGMPNELDLAIGHNVQLGQIIMDGDRMTVHLRGAAHDELLVIDSRRGRLVSKIRLRRAAQF